MTSRVKELLSDSKDADEIELREIVEELAEIALSAERFVAGEHELAEAVRAFADWQYGGYGDREPTTRSVVGRHLWYEVSERVYAVTGSQPKAPTFGASGYDAK